jgi:hypothetical protein
MAVLLGALVFTTTRTEPPPSPLPNPNGYDDFIKAAGMVQGDVGNASTLEHDELRALVSTNAEVLSLVRLGLSRRCSIPADWTTNISGVVSELGQVKSLARLLAEEGRLAEMEGRRGDAMHSYLDTIRFGNEMSRGGFIIIRLVGIACEAIGNSGLSRLAPSLTPEETRQAAAELEKIDSAAVPWEEVQRNEKRFARAQLGKGFNLVTWAMTRWQAWRSIQVAERRGKRMTAHARLLTAELGLRSYQAEQGHPPAELKELVPKYLQRVPFDPFSSKPLIYRPQGTNWLLYSIGEDGVDDGGKRVGRSSPGKVTQGDIFYDSPY